MAESVGFFSRLGNLWSGFVSLWISDVEKKHPEIAYENAINSMVAKYAKLKQATAAIIRRRDEITDRLEKEEKELAQVGNDVNTAIDTGQDDLALVLLQKKNAIEAEIAGLRQEMDQAKADADDAKSSLMAVKDEIKKLKAEKDRMLAKMKSAEARVKIQDQIEGLSVDAEVKALDNVRDHIKTTVAQANLNKEMADSDLDNRLKKLRRSSGDSTARAQLEALKKARQTGGEAEPNKSM